MAKETVLVTGGAGFIGSHLCLRLFDEGHHVICLDNFFTGRMENFDNRFKELQHSGRFEFIRHDVVEPIILEVDQVFHLACPASPVHYQHNPVKTIKTNVIGTYHMLGLAKREKTRILLKITSEVYGDPQVHPQPESYWGHVNPIGIRSCYDEGKRVAETLAMDYHRQQEVDTRIVRIFNTYGPHMCVDDGRVMSNFICQGLRGEPLTIYGDGSQTRSFCYVSDLIDGFLKLMAYESSDDDCHQPVNLGNDREISMLELVKTIEKTLGKPLNIVNNPLPQDDPTRRRPDLTRARRVLGYEPKVALEEGLDQTVRFFKKALDV